MSRRILIPEFKAGPVHLVRERGVRVAQAAWDLDLHANMLRRLVKDPTPLMIKLNCSMHLPSLSEDQAQRATARRINN
jgi:transposase-like protein